MTGEIKVKGCRTCPLCAYSDSNGMASVWYCYLTKSSIAVDEDPPDGPLPDCPLRAGPATVMLTTAT